MELKFAAFAPLKHNNLQHGLKPVLASSKEPQRVQSPGPVVSGKSGRAGESHLRVRCGAAHHNHPAPCITKGKDRFQGGRREGGERAPSRTLRGSCAACDSREYHHGSTCYDELMNANMQPCGVEGSK